MAWHQNRDYRGLIWGGVISYAVGGLTLTALAAFAGDARMAVLGMMFVGAAVWIVWPVLFRTRLEDKS